MTAAPGKGDNQAQDLAAPFIVILVILFIVLSCIICYIVKKFKICHCKKTHVVAVSENVEEPCTQQTSGN